MAAPKRKGLKLGNKSEFTVFAKVKSGHANALRQIVGAARSDPASQEKAQEVLDAIGTLHEARWVLFDDDTRLMFCSSFDGDWDVYIDDFAGSIAKDFFEAALQHVEGFPGISAPTIKDWFMAHTVEAASYLISYGGTVKEIKKALEFQKAFQKVLDDPAAEKALANPVFKPLLPYAST